MTSLNIMFCSLKFNECQLLILTFYSKKCNLFLLSSIKPPERKVFQMSNNPYDKIVIDVNKKVIILQEILKAFKGLMTPDHEEQIKNAISIGQEVIQMVRSVESSINKVREEGGFIVGGVDKVFDALRAKLKEFDSAIESIKSQGVLKPTVH